MLWVMMTVLSLGASASGQDAAVTAQKEFAQPVLRMRLEGETGKRLDAVVHNWILPAPDANPGMLEMMRLRDRKPPYEDPMPWAGEFIGKYLTSAVLARRMSDEPELDALIRRIVPELIATQAADGYLGPFPKDHLLANWDLWGHYHCMLGLYLWYRDTGDRTALDAALKAADLMCATFLDTDKRVHDAGSHEMNMAPMHILGLLYRETGREPYLRLMKEIQADWEKPPAGDYFRLALEEVPYYLTPKPRWESLHSMQGLAEFYRITGDERYKKAMLHWWRSIDATDVHNSGSFSTNEQAVGNPFQNGSIETCCTVAWLAYSVDALRLSMDSTVADAIEQATWNTVLGCFNPSGRWATYDTPMNGKRLASAHAIVFQSRPGTPELNCCSVNAPRGLGLISEWAVLGDNAGLYLNYYGPGNIDAQLGKDDVWRFAQKTDYPAGGKVRIEVWPGQNKDAPVYLRIPAWSKETQIAVNGEALSGVRPGTYQRIQRTWKDKDAIEISFDMGLRVLRADKHQDFRCSFFHGPLLLAVDQHHNSIEPEQVPELDCQALTLTPETPEGRFAPIVEFRTATPDGDVHFVDFATAGAYGDQYRTWLRAKNAPDAPFQLEYPELGARLPVGTIPFVWAAGPEGSTYTFVVAEDPEMKQVVAREKNLVEPRRDFSANLESGKTYYWQVEKGEPGKGAIVSMNGPCRFTVDAALPSNLSGTVLDAPLSGDAQPREGALESANGVTPAANRKNEEKGALAFDGKTSKLVYAAPAFPTRTYSFAAWFKVNEVHPEDKAWHHIFSAWAKGSDDPLRVSVVGKELQANIENSVSGRRLSGGPIDAGVWTHVAVVKGFSELRIYVNGKRIATTDAAPVLSTDAKNVGIGCNPNYPELEGFNGAISDVVFVREAWTDEEVAARAGK
jgi:hypothetical protein